jgi:thiamine-phosphate pyrophosphorylase
VIVNVSADSDFDTVLELTKAVVGAGAPVVQLRFKGVTDAAAFELATAMAQVCAAGGTTLLVNDRVDMALAVGADGVHVGDDDMPVAVARRLLGPLAVVGATARTADAARRAAAAGATYVGVGPCYPTTTKVVDAAVLGPSGVAAVTSAVDIPVIAIAGVTAARVPELVAAGAYGVAVVGAVAAATDPALATKELIDALGERSQP